VIASNTEGLAGAIVLLVRRQLANMANRVGQRIVGSLLSRLVLIFADGIGLVLIAKDIYEMWHGVLPIIAKEMKSNDSKEKVREELAKTISEQISEHSRDIAAKTSERVVEIWQDFKKAHAKVIDLAERNDGFKRYLELQKPEQLGRLDEIVALIHGAEGEAGVLKRLGDGTLDIGVNHLPTAGLEIARDKRSLDAALSWMTLAGPNLAKITEFDLHRLSSPDQFSKASLARVLGLAERTPVTRVASLKREARDTLLDLDDAALTRIAKGLDAGQLETLSSYLTGLSKPAAQRVLKTVALAPSRMQVFASPRVRDAVLRSRDQMAAVEMLLAEGPAIEPVAIAHDVRMIMDGKVSPILLYDRHPSALAIAAALSFILLAMMKRLLFGRRRAKVFVPANRDS
jgi:hypothetical protein